MRLYDYGESGNAYKVRLLLSQLGISFERVELDILAGQTRTPEFRERNPNHRIPLLELEDGRRLAESNAILFHLAQGTELWPADPWQQAQVLQWMFFEQYSHEPCIAVVRFWQFSGAIGTRRSEEVAERRERGHEALGVMEAHLEGERFFVGGRYTVADIALYAYTHVAHEGGFDLGTYPAVRAWLARVASQPSHVRITDPTGEVAEVPWSDRGTGETGDAGAR